ncbi:MAG: hypothetical protein R3C97_11535 [Geminicoccaceae bacterium]
MAATVNHISKLMKVSAMTFLPSVVRSNIAIVDTMAEFLMRLTTALVNGGSMIGTACGRTMRA